MDDESRWNRHLGSTLLVASGLCVAGLVGLLVWVLTRGQG